MATLQTKFYVRNFFVLGNFFRELVDKLSKRAMMKLASVNTISRFNCAICLRLFRCGVCSFYLA